MKQFVLIAILVVLPVVAMAQDFLPTQMTLSAEALVQYDFDGSALQIPVTVTGTPAGLIFSVFTQGKGEDIGRVINGYLDWHEVANIDTCVYFSSTYSFPTGTSSVTWNGQTHVTYMQEGDGADLVPAGNYTYYMWAYDNVNPRTLATIDTGNLSRGAASIHDEDSLGNPLAQPYICGMMSNRDHDGDGEGDYPYKTLFIWNLGNNPLSSDLLETTYTYDDGDGLITEDAPSGQICFDPNEPEYFYMVRDDRDAEKKSVYRYQWVSDGEGIRDTEWGPDLTWSPPGKVNKSCGVKTDGTYLFTFTNDQGNTEDASTYAYIIDMAEGEMLHEFIHEDWTDYEAYAGGEGATYLSGGGPTYIQYRVSSGLGKIHVGSFVCLKQALDPAKYMETEEYRDFIVWTNKNGDWISDFNWQDDAVYKWTCFGESPPKNRTHVADSMGWVINMVGSYGTVSFDLFAPDGTGIDYFSVVGDPDRSSGFAAPCDTGGGPWDGIYVDNAGGESDANSQHFVANDVITGTITNVIGVADDAPAAFAVAQNSPNPFNPTTTINFDIPEAGHVSVDVFNVAGQKVDTLVNNTLQSGNHTVTFDGANLAAGVYFYTVKASDFSKTMKMTLLK